MCLVCTSQWSRRLFADLLCFVRAFIMLCSAGMGCVCVCMWTTRLSHNMYNMSFVHQDASVETVLVLCTALSWQGAASWCKTDLALHCFKVALIVTLCVSYGVGGPAQSHLSLRRYIPRTSEPWCAHMALGLYTACKVCTFTAVWMHKSVGSEGSGSVQHQTVHQGGVIFITSDHHADHTATCLHNSHILQHVVFHNHGNSTGHSSAC